MNQQAVEDKKIWKSTYATLMETFALRSLNKEGVDLASFSEKGVTAKTSVMDEIKSRFSKVKPIEQDSTAKAVLSCIFIERFVAQNTKMINDHHPVNFNFIETNINLIGSARNNDALARQKQLQNALALIKPNNNTNVKAREELTKEFNQFQASYNKTLKEFNQFQQDYNKATVSSIAPQDASQFKAEAEKLSLEFKNLKAAESKLSIKINHLKAAESKELKEVTKITDDVNKALDFYKVKVTVSQQPVPESHKPE